VPVLPFGSACASRIHRRRSDGGDARAFASVPGQPNHLYLGTTNSWLYESLDEGATWHRVARLDRGDGFVIDSIVVDSAHPSTLYVGAWKNTDDGGLWISHDAGRTWHETAFFKGQAIYALTPAPSDPHMLFAGTLQGVYRSSDSGATWTRSARPAVTRSTKLNLWLSIPQIPAPSTQEHGTCHGRPQMAARPGATSRKD